jgi:DnaJ-class molecular chaperone
VLRVVTPTNLDREEKELLRQFQKLRQESDGRRRGKDRKGSTL